MEQRHRKFKLIENENSFSVIKDVETNEKHLCFRLYHKEGDEFLMFIKQNLPEDNKVRFGYSILNLYELGKWYKFNIKRIFDDVTAITNHIHLEFYIPTYFLSDENIDSGEIDLQVKVIDLEENKLMFEVPESVKIDFKSVAELDFEKDKMYMLRIDSSYYNKNGNRYAILDYNGYKVKASLPKALNGKHLEHKLPFFLGNYDNGEPSLFIDNKYLNSRFYEVGESYNFTIRLKHHDAEQGVSYWVLDDENHLTHLYYPNSDMSFNYNVDSFNNGETIRLAVRGFSHHGALRLVNKIVEVEEAKYTAEELFKSIGYENKIDAYFYTDQEKDEDEELSDEVRESHLKQSYLSQYNEGENLWVFTYLSTLDRKIYDKLDQRDFDEAQELLDLYIKIEKWILEGSDFLSNFSKSTIDDIIIKAETKITRYSFFKNALNMFLEGTVEGYLTIIQNRLMVSPYLSKDNKQTFIEIVKASKYFLDELTDDVIFEVMLLAIKHDLYEYDELSTINIELGLKVRALRVVLLNEDAKSLLRMLTKNQYLMAVISGERVGTHRATISTAMFFRYLGTMYDDVRYHNLSIYSLVNHTHINSRIHKFRDFEEVTYGEFSNIINDNITPRDSYTMLSGSIEAMNNHIMYTPFNLYRGKSYNTSSVVAKMPGFNMIWKSDFDVGTLSTSMEADELVETAINILGFSRIVSKLDINEVDLDKVYRGRVKTFGKKGKYFFVSFIINQQIYNTILHQNKFNRMRMNIPLSNFVRVNDEVRFKIVGQDDKGNVRIEGVEISNEKISELLERPRLTKAIVVAVYNNVAFAITQTGLPIVFYDNKVEERKVYKVEVGDYDRDTNNFKVLSYEAVDEYFVESIEDLWRQYLIDSEFLVPEQNTEEQIYFSPDSNPQEDKKLVDITLQLIYGLEQRLGYINNEQELILNYCFITVMSGITKHSKSYLYSSKLQLLSLIYKLRRESQLDELLNVDTNLNQVIDALLNDESAVDIIRHLGSKNIEVPIEIGKDSNLMVLKKLVETYNLFDVKAENHHLLDYFRKLIVNEFNSVVLKGESCEFALYEIAQKEKSNKEEKNNDMRFEKINIGSESKYVEFKSSFFFSASKYDQREVVLRTVAGFLNAYDGVGKLYIGVDNNGYVVGLHSDLNYAGTIRTLDEYQNYIQMQIADAFPKVINAILDYKFHTVGNKTYLEITIPNYEYPVDYKGEFYQRQGVQTRILKGSDLSQFIINKQLGVIPDKTNGVSDQPAETSEKPSVTESIIEEEVIDEELIINGLPSLYFFDDRTYMISHNQPSVDYLIKLELTKESESSYLLMCYENAYVNKVEASVLADKKHDRRYKNAFNEDAKLKNVLLCHDDEEVAVASVFENEMYMKVYAVNNINPNKLIHLKGTCVLQDQFDRIAEFSIVDSSMDIDDSFRVATKEGRGEKVELGSRTKLTAKEKKKKKR